MVLFYILAVFAGALVGIAVYLLVTRFILKSHADAIVELQNKAGLDFDPTIVKAFIESVLPQPNRNEL